MRFTCKYDEETGDRNVSSTKNVVVGIADFNIARPPMKLVTYALGSCVGICLYDADIKLGGMAHILLPDSTQITNNAQTKKFADTCIAELIKVMLRNGASKTRLRAKIAGGAQMFAMPSNSAISNIGARNIESVKKVLAMNYIPIVAEDVGKNFGRTQTFDPATGIMYIKSGVNGESKF